MSSRLLSVLLLAAVSIGLLGAPSPTASAATPRQRIYLPSTSRETNDVTWTADASAAGTGTAGVRPVGTPTRTTDFGRTAVRVSTSGELVFAVDDAFISKGSVREATVDVSYYDKGFGFFYLMFDAGGSVPQSFGPNTDYQANNVVYMHDSGSWKSYRFNLSNTYFGNALPGAGDFKIVQPHGGSYTLGNAGYDLRIDRVTVTRSTIPVDRASAVEGNFSGFGAPAWVWTRLGSPNLGGHGLYQDERSGATTAVSSGGRRATSGAIYFDVDDPYIKNGHDAAGSPVGEIVIGVEYFDAGSGSFSVVVDAEGGERTVGSVQLGNSNGWRHTAFDARGARFGNGMGGDDLRIVSPSRDLLVRDVVLSRATGGDRNQPVPVGFSRGQRIVGTYYFPVFDGYRPALWPTSTMGPPGAGANGVDNSYSYRSATTVRGDLADMRDAGIDFALVWYANNSIDVNTGAAVAAHQLATAGVPGAPKLGLLLDSVMLKDEPMMRQRGDLIDLADPGTQAQYFKIAEDFFSRIPRSQWATIEGRPIIAVYYQGPDVVKNLDRSVVAKLADRFEAVHGVRPYLMLDRLWDWDFKYGMPADDWFSWGASLAPADQPGFIQPGVSAIGPGFRDPGGRARDRENGAFYTRGWDRAIAAGQHVVLIDTWNYFVEGTAIAPSKEYGRQYLDITRAKASAFHAA